jgi:hypothetical protein
MRRKDGHARGNFCSAARIVVLHDRHSAWLSETK